MRPLLLIALLALLTPCASAQRMVSASPHFASGFHRGGHPRAFFYPLGFSDPFYSDYLSSTGYPVASQPPVVIMQALPAAVPAEDRFPSPAQPLMIELQGDRYVRVSGPEASRAEMIQPEEGGQMQATPSEQRRPSSAAVPATAARDLAPAVLIFRDGHREEDGGTERQSEGDKMQKNDGSLEALESLHRDRARLGDWETGGLGEEIRVPALIPSPSLPVTPSPSHVSSTYSALTAGMRPAACALSRRSWTARRPSGP